MNRREFIAVLAAAAGWPLAGRAQQPERMRRVGVLMIWRETDPVAQASMTALARALEHFGWVSGKNIRIDYRFAAGDAALFKTYADELVGLMPDAILASTPPAVAALREQTRIVFVLLADPVGQGFVHNLARAGGNVTGFSSFDAALMGKWLQLLKEVAPGLTRVTAIFNPATAPYAFFNREIEAAGTSLRMTVTPESHRRAGARVRWRPDMFGGQFYRYTSRRNHRRSNPSPFAADRYESVSQIWRPDVLRVRPSRPVRSGSILHRPHPQGRQSGRPPRSIPKNPDGDCARDGVAQL